MGSAGNDDLVGDGNGDILYGEDGDDRLRGDSGDDLLFGGSGEDELFGGLGADSLTGEGGADVFVIGRDGSIDTISDFTPSEDNINLLGGLVFEDLSIELATGTLSSATVLTVSSSGEQLALLPGLNPTALPESNFIQQDCI
ncbi:MAG: hypothetical protein J7641_19130 [Cyanobacteria bacterium SID2]|nr:hypothetical protein [Cyanobacteria bacterium SID2]MBP0006679.1 hypothetical protein [Cyanobacteria bacterium SBC]